MERITTSRKRGPSLCSECGPNINTDDVMFTKKEANLVYMDKVYSYNKASSCPILFSLPEGQCIDFRTKIKLEPIDDQKCTCGKGTNANCCCCCCPPANNCYIGPDASFTVTRSYVLVNSLTPLPRSIDECNVSIDGIKVDEVSESGNQYTVSANTAILDASKTRCMDLGLPTKSFFLIDKIGPWIFKGTIVLEGTVNSGGKTCCFQAKFETLDRGIMIDGLSTFAIPKLAIPCIANGIEPTIRFNFTGKVFVLNPEIFLDCRERDRFYVMTGCLAIQPEVNVEVSRRTLFCLDACEGLLPCEGTESAYELDADEDCTWPPAPACRCGTMPSPSNDPDLCDTSIICDFDRRKCNNQQDDKRDDKTSPNSCVMQWTGCNGCRSW